MTGEPNIRILLGQAEYSHRTVATYLSDQITLKVGGCLVGLTYIFRDRTVSRNIRQSGSVDVWITMPSSSTSDKWTVKVFEPLVFMIESSHSHGCCNQLEL